MGIFFAIIVYLLLTYGTRIHEACCYVLAYLITWNLFTPFLGHEWTYVAMVHSSSQQAMTRASDQLHTTSFCSPPVLGNKATHTPHATHAIHGRVWCSSSEVVLCPILYCIDVSSTYLGEILDFVVVHWSFIFVSRVSRLIVEFIW
jgi:hypothetical protein